MNYLIIFILLGLLSCSHQTKSDLSPKLISHDSAAKGKIKAQAIKVIKKSGVCFDISLHMTGGERDEASPSNWTVAWVDKNQMYHLLKLKQRDPASIPKMKKVLFPTSTYHQWSNNFKTCAPNTKPEDISALVMSPKGTSFLENSELRLRWE